MTIPKWKWKAGTYGTPPEGQPAGGTTYEQKTTSSPTTSPSGGTSYSSVKTSYKTKTAPYSSPTEPLSTQKTADETNPILSTYQEINTPNLVKEEIIKQETLSQPSGSYTPPPIPTQTEKTIIKDTSSSHVSTGIIEPAKSGMPSSTFVADIFKEQTTPDYIKKQADILVQEQKSQVRPPTPSTPSIPAPSPLTIKELQTQTQQQEQKTYQDAIKSIDPTATYTRDGQEIPGFVLQAELQTGYKQAGGKTYGLDQYPVGTTFTPTSSGEYDVHLPEGIELSRTKKELKEIDTLPIGVREVARTGYFLNQTMYSVTKPVAQLLGLGGIHDTATNIGMSTAIHPFQPDKYVPSIIKGKEAGTYGVHHVSLFDYAFEPIGWSPKGSTDILKKYPVESTLGGLGGEIAQGIIIGSAASKFTTKVVKPVTRSFVKGGVKAYSKFTKVFPEEKLLTRSGQKIGETTFGRNLVRWGTKGYEPVTRLGSTSVTKATENVLRDDATITRVLNRDIIQKGGRRVFASPSDIKHGSKSLSKILNEPNTITFPTVLEAKQGVYTTRLQKSMVKGVFNKRLVTMEQVAYTSWDDAALKTPSKGLIISSRYQYPGFVRMKAGDTSLLKQSDDVVESSYVTQLKPSKGRFHLDDILDVEKTMKGGIDDVYDVGRGGFPYKKPEPVGALYEYRSQGLGQVTPGTRSTKTGFYSGPSADDPMQAWSRSAEKAQQTWMSRYRWKNPLKSLREDVFGMQRVVPQVDTTFLKTTSKTNMGRLGLIRQASGPSLIKTIPIHSTAALIGVGSKTIIPHQKTIRQQSIAPKISIVKPITLGKQHMYQPKTIQEIIPETRDHSRGRSDVLSLPIPSTMYQKNIGTTKLWQGKTIIKQGTKDKQQEWYPKITLQTPKKQPKDIFMQTPVEDTIPAYIRTPVSIEEIDQTTKTILKQQQKPMKAVRAGFKVPVTRKTQPIQVSVPVLPPLWYPKGGGDGRGRRGFSFGRMPTYRFREFKIPDIDKLVKNIGL